MATFRKRGKTWHVEVGSRANRRFASFPTKAQAIAWAAESENPASRHTLADALDRYEADISPKMRGHEWNVKVLNKFRESFSFIGSLIDQVEPDQIATWRDDQIKSGLKSATVRRQLVLLSAVFQSAKMEWRWVKHNPVRDIRNPPSSPPRNRTYTDAEIKLIVDKLGFDGKHVTMKIHEVAVAFLFALETAMRAGEIVSLGPEQVRGRVAYLEMTKNGESREVPLSKEALRLLTIMQGRLTKDGAKIDKYFSLNAEQLSALFKKYRREAKIDDATFHDTRRTAITRLAKKLDVLNLAKMSGHKDVRMLLNVYYKADSESVAKLLD